MPFSRRETFASTKDKTTEQVTKFNYFVIVMLSRKEFAADEGRSKLSSLTSVQAIILVGRNGFRPTLVSSGSEWR